MKIDQIAYLIGLKSDAKNAAAAFGLSLSRNTWIEDTATYDSDILTQGGWKTFKDCKAELLFCYDHGIEFEILRVIRGPTWHDYHDPRLLSIIRPGAYIQSHIGIHLAEGEDFPEFGPELVQRTKTKVHTAPFLNLPGSPGFGRTYEYRIHQLADDTFIKYIKRIPRVTDAKSP